MIIHARPWRFKVEIGDFVTKRRSGRGFWRRVGGRKRRLRAFGGMLASIPNVILMPVSQPRLSLSGIP